MSLDHAKRLRKSMTDAERRLWFRLRAHRLNGVKFKRQVPIGPYVVDFVSIAHKLIIEADGGQHGVEADMARTAWLQQQGYRVIRFWNNDILRNTFAVLEEIDRMIALQGRPSPDALRAPPSPVPGEGKESK